MVVNYVAIGNGATGARQIMRSNDLVTWLTVSSPTDNFGGTCIANFGAGKFCALALASDGVTWIAITSTDGGVSWTSNAIVQPNSGGTYVDIVWGGGLLVGLSSDGDVITSTDGFTWANPANLFLSLSKNLWATITYGAGLYIAVNNADHALAAATSPDAAAWSLQNTDVGGNTNAIYTGVCYGGGQYVAVNRGTIDPFGLYSVITSPAPDGTVWTGHAKNGTDPVSLTAGYVAYGAGVYVATGYFTNDVYTSADGDLWAVNTPAGATALTRVRYVNNLFLLCQSGSILAAPDGSAWTTHASPLDVVADIAAEVGVRPFGNVLGGAGAGMTQNPANCFV